jgi:protein phosphatase
MQFTINGCSDKGTVRKNNEDKFGYIKTDFGIVAVVCDGMGGYEGGEIASEIAVNTLIEYFQTLSAGFELHREVINSFKAANEAIIMKGRKTKELSMMGTTAAFILINDSQFVTAHLGDSRIYLIRNSLIKPLTKDHSQVQQLMDNGNISYDEAINLTDKNVITRVLGINELSKPEVSIPAKVEPNDIFVLCSDGLTNYLNENDILDIVYDSTPEKACEQLIYLANLRGGDDNITAVIVKAKNI